MKCHLHPEIDATAICTTCGKFVCATCQVTVEGKSTCISCIKKELGGALPTKPKNVFTHALLTFFPLMPVGVNHYYATGGKGGLLYLMATIVLFMGLVVRSHSLTTVALFGFGLNVLRLVSYHQGLTKLKKTTFFNLNLKPLRMAMLCGFVVISMTFGIFLTDPVMPQLIVVPALFFGVMGFLLLLQGKAIRPLKDVKPTQLDANAPAETNPKPTDTEPLTGKLLFDHLQQKLNDKAKALAGSDIATQVQTISILTGKIHTHIEKNPQKLRQINKFVEYYLPTTLTLLDNYADLKAQGASGRHITKATSKIEALLQTLSVAYENQLDALFEDKAIDIDAEIKVLKTILNKEGLLEQK